MVFISFSFCVFFVLSGFIIAEMSDILVVIMVHIKKRASLCLAARLCWVRESEERELHGGAENFLKIMSYVGTARKQGVNPFSAILLALNGEPKVCWA
jgi:hypothetical protein